MLRALFLTLPALLLLSPMAHAYKDGTFRCKNPEAGLPPVIYKIVSIDMPAAGGNVPYVEITEYYHDDRALQAGPVHEIHHKGLASVATDELGNETLNMDNLHMELKNNELVHCTPQ